MTDQTEPTPNPPRKLFLYLSIGAVLAALAGAVAFLIKRLRDRRRHEAAEAPEAWSSGPLPVEGLSEDEASARFVEGRDNSILFKPPRSRRTLVRESLLTVFNVGLIAIAMVQLMFGRPLDALISIGVLIFSVVASVFQNEFARLRLRDLYEASRLSVTVIRGGKGRNIDPTDLVEGDAVAIGPGELILADGVLVGDGQVAVDESMVNGQSSGTIKGEGDQIYAGSFCLFGRAIYEADQLGEDRQIVSRLEAAEAADLQLTPIEQILRRILTFVLVLALGLTGFFIVQYFQIKTPIPDELFIDALTVILNLAPASLFFMIVLTYTAATADLSQFGALVARSRSVESISQVDVVCFSKSGMLSGGRLELSLIELPENIEPLPEHRIRQILGDYARTISTSGAIKRMAADTFEGTRRIMVEEMPFATIYGWSGLVIDEEDMQGVFVLAEPETIQANLIQRQDTTETETESESVSGRVLNQVSSIGTSLTGLFRRSSNDEENAEEGAEAADEAVAQQASQAHETQENDPDGEASEKSSGGFFSRVRNSVVRFMSPSDEDPSEETETEKDIEPDLQFIFAYRPDIVPLYGPDGEPVLPTGLIPLCSLDVHEQVRPEALDAAQAFDEQGVNVKIFSPDPPEKIAQQLTRAGLSETSEQLKHVVHGDELHGLSELELLRMVWDNSVFGALTIDQTAQITKILRTAGHTVALLGDNVQDVPALLQANLTLLRHTSDPATLSLADIILTDDSPTVISKLLNRGRRIVNGLVDILKLYLTQIFYTLFLILLIRIFSHGFPFTSAEGGMIAVFTLTIPAVGLSLWASKRRPPSKNLARRLTTFFVPAALTIALVGFYIYELFRDVYGEIEYAQTGLTHALIVMGLLLVLFINPPLQFSGLARPERRDTRATILAVISAVLFFITTQIPLAQELLKIYPLENVEDYLVVITAGIVWAVVFLITLILVRWLIGLIPSKPDITPEEQLKTAAEPENTAPTAVP